MPDVVAGPRARSVSPRLTWLFVLACSGLAIALVVAATRHGPGISVDSTFYLSAGRNLADGHGLVAFNGTSLTHFPPGFPVVVAMLVKLGVGAPDAARYANALAFGTIVVLSYVLLRRHVRSRVITAMSTGLIAISPSLLSISAMAWSEPLFVIVTVVLLLTLGNVLDGGHGNRLPLVLGSATLVWIGFMVRYAGIALLVLGTIVILASRFRSGLRRAIVCAAAFGALSMAVPALWMTRNVVLGADPIGTREQSTRSAMTNTSDAIDTASKFLAPERVPSPWRVLALIALMAVAGRVIWIVTARSATSPTSVPALLPVVGFLVVYCAFVITSASISAVDPVDDRLLSPLVVPFVVLIAWTADHLPDVVRVECRRVVSIAVVAILGVWLLGSLVRTTDLVAVGARDGAGYASSQWQNSPLMAAVARAPERSLVYSNDPFAVYFVTGRQPVYTIPARVAGRSGEPTGAVRKLVLRACEGHVLLAWSIRTENLFVSPRLTPSELQRVVVLERITTTKDGILFRIAPKIDGQRRSCSAE